MAKFKELLPSERPREKAIYYGVESLHDYELLALILGSGNRQKDVIELSEFILKTYKNFANLALENYGGLSSIEGIKKSKTLLLLAIFEFHKRVLKSIDSDDLKVRDAYSLYHKYYHLTYEEQERLILLLVNSKKYIIKEIELYKGTSDSLNVSFKEIVSQVLSSKAPYFILIHNHPNGGALPSEMDLYVTNKIIQKSSGLDIMLIDHLIVAKEGYYSFQENEIIKCKKNLFNKKVAQH